MSLKKTARSVFERLPEPVRKKLIDRRMQLRTVRGLNTIRANQAMLAKRLADIEREQGRWANDPAQVPDDRFPPIARTRLCTQALMEQEWFPKWCEATGWPPLFHRKLWEFAYIGEVLQQLGQLEPGRTGLGFGVGHEPLVPAFANLGVRVLASDLAPDDREAIGWARSGQHAESVEAMQRPDLCDPVKFRELVSWRDVDMRAIPNDLRGYDFCWSACSLEHLGTLQAGADFIVNSLDTLRPGGIAVHTTEYNISSNEDTIEQGGTVVYRERDVMEIVKRIEDAGHEVAAVDLDPGDGVFDQYIDTPPYGNEPVLRFLLGTYTLTSVAFVIRTRQ